MIARLKHRWTSADDALNTLAAAGNPAEPKPYLSGTVMLTPQPGRIQVTNASRGSGLAPDWTDPNHLMRVVEDGEVTHAGVDSQGLAYDVWVRFGTGGAPAGDCRPLGNLAAARAAVANDGTIHLLPGASPLRGSLGGGRINVRLTAPLGGVCLGGS